MLVHLLTRLLSKTHILIGQDGYARLAGFGLLTVSDSTHTTASSSSGAAGATRWMSPERLIPDRFGFEDGRATKGSDCYAFGMVIFEVLTGRAPFPRHNDLTVTVRTVDGERPTRPTGPGAVWFTDALWGMLEQCWSPQPNVRPTAEAILEHLERGSMAWNLLSPTADGSHAGDDDDFRLDDDDFPSDNDDDLQTGDFPSDDGDDLQTSDFPSDDDDNLQTGDFPSDDGDDLPAGDFLSDYGDDFQTGNDDTW